MKIKSSTEFNALMTEVDVELRTEEIPITARALYGMGKVAKRLNIEIKGGPLHSGPIPGNYEGDSLSAHIFTWFDRRYGNRQKNDFSIGATIFKINGDPWLVSFPKILGRVRLICEPDLSKIFPNRSIARPGQKFVPPFLNVFTCIENIPESNIQMLSFDQHKELMRDFVSSLQTFQGLEELAVSNPLAEAVRYDLTAAARNCCHSNQEYGQSRWLSLQGAEKVLKLYLSQLGKSFPHTHKLTTLNQLAQNIGMPSIPDNNISEIQCNAGVRYGNVKVSLSEAVKAQISAFSVAINVVKALGLACIKEEG